MVKERHTSRFCQVSNVLHVLLELARPLMQMAIPAANKWQAVLFAALHVKIPPGLIEALVAIMTKATTASLEAPYPTSLEDE